MIILPVTVDEKHQILDEDKNIILNAYCTHFYSFGAGSSLQLRPAYHVVLSTVGIVHPGLLTLAQTPNISEFSGIT